MSVYKRTPGNPLLGTHSWDLNCRFHRSVDVGGRPLGDGAFLSEALCCRLPTLLTNPSLKPRGCAHVFWI